MQVCSTCFAEKPFAEFYPASRGRRGFEKRCKACKNARVVALNRSRRLKNPAEFKAKVGEWLDARKGRDLSQGATERCCTGCKTTKPLAEFRPDPRGRFGTTARCNACVAAYAAERFRVRYADSETRAELKRRSLAAYHADHEVSRERVRVKAAKRRAENPEAERAKVRAWRNANKDKVKAARVAKADHYRALARAYRRKNAERINAYWRDRWAAESSVLIAKNARRKAHKMNAPGNGVSAAQWRELLEVHDHRCAYCLQKAPKLEMDHVEALSRGGAHDSDNIVPACESCNSSKKARPLIACFAPGLVIAERMGNHFAT